MHIDVNYFNDKKVAAVGGRIVVLDTVHSSLVQIQKLEFVNTFQVNRSFFGKINGQCLTSGEFGVFRKSALINIEGFNINTVGEDMEIILRLQDAGKRRNVNKIAYAKKLYVIQMYHIV